jgi:hypothetical protein
LLAQMWEGLMFSLVVSARVATESFVNRNDSPL